jgi:hypothetical protein
MYRYLVVGTPHSCLVTFEEAIESVIGKRNFVTSFEDATGGERTLSFLEKVEDVDILILIAGFQDEAENILQKVTLRRKLAKKPYIILIEVERYKDKSWVFPLVSKLNWLRIDDAIPISGLMFPDCRVSIVDELTLLLSFCLKKAETHLKLEYEIEARGLIAI